MTTQTQEDGVIQFALGVLEDARTIAREMLARGETLRPYPTQGETMFSIAASRDQLSQVLGEIQIEGTPFFIGRQATDDAQSASPGTR